MDKKRHTSKVNDIQLCHTGSPDRSADTQRGTKKLGQAEVPETRRRVSYIPGVSPREEPSKLPRLFIRGGGGSVKMDLSGIGFEFSPGAFAFSMPDESLNGLEIHRGDIALIQPPTRALQEGDLLLITVDGQETLRRITKSKKIWYFHAADGENPKLFPLWDHPFEGIAIGIMRMFEVLKPVRYRRKASQHDFHGEIGPDHTNTHRAKLPPKTVHGTGRYRIRKKHFALLAAEARGALRLSEIDQISPYSS